MSDDPNARGLSRKHIFEAVDASLERLGTDYIDLLYQAHRFDAETPLEESLQALNDVVRSGTVRYLGVSSIHAWQFMKTLDLQRQYGWAPFVSMQNHYNLLYRVEEREMLPLCRSEGIVVIPRSPFARGYCAGKRGRPTAATVRSRSASAREASSAFMRDMLTIDVPVVPTCWLTADALRQYRRALRSSCYDMVDHSMRRGSEWRRYSVKESDTRIGADPRASRSKHHVTQFWV